jgi:predicted ATPase
VTEDTERLFVLTGGPGLGKTTLIEALARLAMQRRSRPGGRSFTATASAGRTSKPQHRQRIPCNVYGLAVRSGDRAGTWSISVSGNWRITFDVEDDEISSLNLEDYH